MTPNAARDRLRQAKSVIRMGWRDLRFNILGQCLPVYPWILNLLVNDACNSRCRMCGVWKKAPSRFFTPFELGAILRNPLFKRIKYVGVSGGEPTLRSDLPQLFHVLAQDLPELNGAGIITNARCEEAAIMAVRSCAKVCRDAGIAFRVMISLDGVGTIHDQVRGCKGNFESAASVMRYLRDQTNIPVTAACTIMKTNALHVDEVLDFCRQENIYARFRIAEFIDRLDNDEQRTEIRNFSPVEIHHLALFLAKLEYAYETSPVIKRNYRNMRQMLLEGAPRSVKCHWQTSAVTLDAIGRLRYCSPHSEPLGNCIEQSARDLYFKNIDHRRRILDSHCSQCIHDYSGDSTIKEWIAGWRSQLRRRAMSLERSLARAASDGPGKRARRKKTVGPRMLIVGWYGTETIGDMAILGEILHRIEKEHPDAQVAVASLYPFMTRQSVRELERPDVTVVDVSGASFRRHLQTADEVIMGGGPLMGIEPLGIVLSAFLEAKKAGRCVRIAGCGVGPIQEGSKHEDALRRILQLADCVELRDSASVGRASRLCGRTDIRNTGEPAAAYAARWRKSHPSPPKTRFLNLYLRDWPFEYRGALSRERFRTIKIQFESELALWIRELCRRLDLRPRLLAMHHFCIGGDDRDFNRRFCKMHLADLHPMVELAPFSIKKILVSMQEAALCLCMRFHSVVFAQTLGAPFMAIDYTQGEKIASYLADCRQIDRCIDIKDVSAGKWRVMMEAASGIAREAGHQA